MPGTGSQDAVSRAILPAQILDDGLKHADVVVYGENDWLPHMISVYYQSGRTLKTDPCFPVKKKMLSPGYFFLPNSIILG